MMYTNIFDTHSHYMDKAFDSDRMELLSSFPKNGVSRVMLAGCTPEDSLASLKLAEQFSFVWCAVGIHPCNVNGESEQDLLKIADLTAHEKAVAIGEIGLDYHFEGYDKELQIKIFSAQLELANRLNLPVIVHIRDAMADALSILQQYRPKGVVHCWSGSLEMAKELIKIGMYLGFGGVATYKNARKVVQTLQQIPSERMLLETDCPYLAPVPFRGERCDSRMIAYTAERIAEIRNTEPQKIIDVCCENGKQLFQIP